jgi:hypothetical protein
MTFGQLGFDQMSIHCTVNQLPHSIKWYVDQMVIKQLTLHREKVLSMVSTLYPDHQGQGTLNRVWSVSTALTVSLGKTFIKTKVVGKDHFSGGRSYFWAHNPDLEGPGPLVLLEPWLIIFWQSLLNQSCSAPSQ